MTYKNKKQKIENKGLNEERLEELKTTRQLDIFLVLWKSSKYLLIRQKKIPFRELLTRS